jgi:hypothetical protein
MQICRSFALVSFRIVAAAPPAARESGHRRVRKPARSALRSASGRTGHKEKAGRRLLRSAATTAITQNKKDDGAAHEHLPEVRDTV